jgi:TolB-like protein/tetratricopeptide (TPR) repeat protein
VTTPGAPDPLALPLLRAALAGRYEIERELGQGAFATVYLARDWRHERRVALKVLNADPGSEAGELRFIREIRLLARLQHPNILPLLDSGHVETLLYYLMPYVSGETLRARMSRERQLPIDAAVRIACESADALAYAHGEGVIHRDIKPENILLSGNHAIVADFGIARVIDVSGVRQLTRTGMGGPGTPAYMSPEQLLGDHELDGRSDIYSLGCVLYEMLTGKPPFAGKEGFVKRFTESGPRPSAIRKDVPASLDNVVAKTLSRDPNERYRVAEDLVSALSGRATSEPSSPSAQSPRIAGSPGAPKHPRFWRARSGAIVGGIVLAIGLLAGVAFMFVPREKLAIAMALARRRPALLHNDRVIVAPFSNETGDQKLTPLGSMAADWIAQALSKTGTLHVVDARTVAITSEVVQRIPWPWKGRDEGKALAQETGAGMLISGRFYRDADTLRFQASVVDVKDGKLLWSLSPVSGPASSPTTVLESLARRIVALVAQTSDTTSSALAMLSDPPSLDAYSEFRRGLEGVFTHSPSAYDHLFRATSLDSTYVTPWVLLAVAAEDRGDKVVMDSALKRAKRLTERMTPVERAIIDYTEAKTSGDLEGTLHAAETVFQLTPGSAESPLLLATAALATRRPHMALGALRAVDPDRGLNLAAPYFWKNQTVAFYQLADYRAAAKACNRGLRRFPKDELLTHFCLSSFIQLHELDKVADLLGHEESVARGAELAAEAARGMSDIGLRSESRQLAMRWLGVLSKARELDYSRAALLMAAERWREAKSTLTAIAATDSARRQLRILGMLGIVNARLQQRDEAFRTDSLLISSPAPAEKGEREILRARIHAQLGDLQGAVTLAEAGRDQGWELVSLTNSLADDHWLVPLRPLSSFQSIIALKD